MALRFGIIGTGYFGRHYIRLLQEIEGVLLVGVAARTNEEIGGLSGSFKKYASANDLLRDPDIDCVVIATPPSTHANFAIFALENNKHVLLEKPMAVSLDEAWAIADIARKSNQICMIGHQYCYNDHIRYLKKELEKKTIGEIKFLVVEHFYPGPIRLDTGCFWETATHELAMIDYLFSSPRAIDITGRMVDMSGSGKDDFATAVIAFDNGLTASITTSWFMPEKTRRIVVAGDNGQAVFDEKKIPPLMFYTQPYPVCESPEFHTSHFFKISDNKKITPDVNPREPLRNQVEHFIECIKEHRVPVTDVEHGMRVTKLLHDITAQMRR